MTSSRYILRRRSALWIANFSRNEDQTTDILYAYMSIYILLLLFCCCTSRTDAVTSSSLLYDVRVYGFWCVHTCVCACVQDASLVTIFRLHLSNLQARNIYLVVSYTWIPPNCRPGAAIHLFSRLYIMQIKIYKH
jgi:hypothetical protein